MPDLSDIFDFSVVQNKFNAPVIVNEYGIEDLDRVLQEETSTMIGVCMNVWNRIVHYGYKQVDPQAVTDLYVNSDPALVGEITKIVGEELIKDLYYVNCQIDDDTLEYTTASKMLLTHVYPNDIHLGDIEFCNPYRPVPKLDRKTRFHHYEGLGLLNQLMENMEAYARTKQCDYLTLTASSLEHMPLFEKYGFTLEDNPSAKEFLKHGNGIPMEKKL